MKMKTQAHRARCWRASHVAEGSLADKGKMDTLARIKMYRFYSPKPTTERMKRFCPSNRGHKELLPMDMKRTDSLVAATRDLSKHLGKQLFNWLMNDHYANSERKKPGKRSANLASKMAVLALVHHCWGVCVSALLGGQEPHSPYASVPRSVHPSSWSQRKASC